MIRRSNIQFLDRKEVLRILEDFSCRPTRTVIPIIKQLNIFTEDSVTATKTMSYMFQCPKCEKIYYTSKKDIDECYFCGSKLEPYHLYEGESKDEEQKNDKTDNKVDAISRVAIINFIDSTLLRSDKMSSIEISVLEAIKSRILREPSVNEE